MENCLLTITTTVDGQETKTTKQAEGECSLSSMRLTYCEENAQVFLSLSDGRLEIFRTGDYSLHLFLKQGETLKGSLSIANSEGELTVHTQKLAYSQTQKSVLLLAHYTLYFGCETQETKIRLQAKFY